MSGQPHQQFADFHWQKRWNGTKGGVVGVTRSAEELTAVTPMGVIHIDREDVPHYVAQMRVALDCIEKEAQA